MFRVLSLSRLGIIATAQRPLQSSLRACTTPAQSSSRPSAADERVASSSCSRACDKRWGEEFVQPGCIFASLCGCRKRLTCGYAIACRPCHARPPAFELRSTETVAVNLVVPNNFGAAAVAAVWNSKMVLELLKSCWCRLRARFGIAYICHHSREHRTNQFEKGESASLKRNRAATNEIKAMLLLSSSRLYHFLVKVTLALKPEPWL